ncbi:MAG: phosphotransferase [Chloroflexi bacterium]|nr:phosphotransferase [Chloroflexota bacterium]
MNELNLPSDFIKNIHNSFDEEGVQFIKELPRLIDEASQLWHLHDVRFVPNLSYNFVAFAGRGKEDVILKIGVPHPELNSEIDALKLFNGNGACQLLESNARRGFFLLERLKPGTMLADLTDDDERTNIAIDVMQKIWREIPSASRAQSASSNEKFIKLTDWFGELKKIRPQYNGGTGPFPKKLLERVESFLPELLADENIKLIHGDFHHFNVLLSERGWLAIDPKGVIGPAGYEIGPLMINPWGSLSDGSNFKAQAKRRMSILSERLGWAQENIIKWATAHAVLSAWWDTRPDGTGGEYSLWCAELFEGL